MSKSESNKPILEDTASGFGKRIAKIMLDLKSSHCYFILQQAYDGEPYDWEDFEILMKNIAKGK